MARGLKTTTYRVTTSASRDVVAREIGAIWSAHRLFSKHPIQEIPGGYRISVTQTVLLNPTRYLLYDIDLQETSAGTQLVTDLHKATVLQSKMFAFIPSGKKRMALSAGYDGVMKTLQQNLRSNGHSVSDESTPFRFGG